MWPNTRVNDHDPFNENDERSPAVVLQHKQAILKNWFRSHTTVDYHNMTKVKYQDSPPIMKDLEYSTVSTVISSWDECKRSPTYNAETLETMVLVKLFELEPRTKLVFGLKDDSQCTVDFVKSGKLSRGIGIIRMLDGALSMLGPDTETLMEILEDLGRRHIKYGVKAQFYPFMGQAILYALSDTLGSKWNKQLENAWQDVYDELSGEMMKSTLLHMEALRQR